MIVCDQSSCTNLTTASSQAPASFQEGGPWTRSYHISAPTGIQDLSSCQQVGFLIYRRLLALFTIRSWPELTSDLCETAGVCLIFF